jgi:general stress protein 26
MEKHKGDVQDLHREDAVDKLKELVKHNPICLFTSRLTQEPFQTRPMSTAQVDDEGNLWFLSASDSYKNEEVDYDPNVQLFYVNTPDSEYLSVFGKAFISTDRQKIDEIWKPIAKAWFTEGKDDPRITLLKVVPEEAYYWDTKTNKMVAMLKILTAAVTGKAMDDDGVEGKLALKSKP